MFQFTPCLSFPFLHAYDLHLLFFFLLASLLIPLRPCCLRRTFHYHFFNIKLLYSSQAVLPFVQSIGSKPLTKLYLLAVQHGLSTDGDHYSTLQSLCRCRSNLSLRCPHVLRIRLRKTSLQINHFLLAFAKFNRCTLLLLIEP